jgi:hypothetical protein
MQTYPGEAVISRDQVLIERLMLVPENYNAESRHRRVES